MHWRNLKLLLCLLNNQRITIQKNARTTQENVIVLSVLTARNSVISCLVATYFMHMNPHSKNGGDPKPALIATQDEDGPVVCLMAKYENSNERKHSYNWYIDSGCNNHMTFDKSKFSFYAPDNHTPVEIGNIETVKAVGDGTIDISINVNGKSTKYRLKNFLCVPDLGYQLLSVATFDKAGLQTSFHSRRCLIEKESVLLATGSMKGKLYCLETSAPEMNQALVAVNMELWHRRLGHVQPNLISHMAFNNIASGLNISKSCSET